MNKADEILGGMGLEYTKPTVDDAMAIAHAVGMGDMDPQKALASYRELKEYRKVKEGCDRCPGFDACPHDGHRGYSASLRAYMGAYTLGYYECAKSITARTARRLAELVQASRIPENLKLMSFKGYDVGQNTPAVDAAKRLVKEKNVPGIILSGKPGTGKTHLAMAILNNRIIMGNEAMYATAPQLFQSIGASYGDRRHDELIELLCNVELLMLDDLGVEKQSDSRMEDLFIIVNSRTSAAKQLIVTTNLTKNEMIERYGSRIASRILASCDWHEIVGRDRRLQ